MSPLPRTARGWLGLLLVAAFLAATTTEHAHRAAVLHAVCGEHGERIHVAATPAALAALACAERCDDAPAGGPEDAPDRAQPHEGRGAAHEHCRLGPLQREAAFQPDDPPGLAQLVPPAVLGLTPPSIDPPRAEPLLLLAPKQSPPV